MSYPYRYIKLHNLGHNVILINVLILNFRQNLVKTRKIANHTTVNNSFKLNFLSLNI